MRAESPRQKHHIAAPHTYLSNAMKRAVGALERTGGFSIPGAVPQADIKRAFGPKHTASHTISLSPTFNHTRVPSLEYFTVAEPVTNTFPSSSTTTAYSPPSL